MKALALFDQATFYEATLRQALDGLTNLARKDGSRGERVLATLQAIADLVGGGNPAGYTVADWVADIEADVIEEQNAEQAPECLSRSGPA